MAQTIPGTHQRIILHPGEHQVCRGQYVLQTLLGSCVAACLFDPGSGISGMNHFLLANKRYAKGMEINITDAGRYGIHAMELLINDMMKQGAVRKRLKAKIFGAGTIVPTHGDDNFFCVGEVNSRFIQEFLATEGIPVLSKDLGGELGRVIHFFTDTYSVFRRFIPKSKISEVERKEHQYWKSEVDKNLIDKPAVIFF